MIYELNHVKTTNHVVGAGQAFPVISGTHRFLFEPPQVPSSLNYLKILKINHLIVHMNSIFSSAWV